MYIPYAVYKTLILFFIFLKKQIIYLKIQLHLSLKLCQIYYNIITNNLLWIMTHG